MELRRRSLQTSPKEKDEVKSNRQQGTGIRCPSCNGQTRVIRSLPKPGKSIHGRYRQCDKCGKKMYTEETIFYLLDDTK